MASFSRSDSTPWILERVGMLDSKSCVTPVDMQAKLSAGGAPINDPTTYHSLVDALQYLTSIKPDIAYGSNRFVPTCTIPGNRTWARLSGSSDTFKILSAIGFFSAPPDPHT